MPSASVDRKGRCNEFRHQYTENKTIGRRSLRPCRAKKRVVAILQQRRVKAYAAALKGLFFDMGHVHERCRLGWLIRSFFPLSGRVDDAIYRTVVLVSALNLASTPIVGPWWPGRRETL